MLLCFVKPFALKQIVLSTGSVALSISMLMLPGTIGMRAAQAANIVTVTNLNDSGLGSLRAAITAANSAAVATTITFNLGGKITLSSSLVIDSSTDPLITIDGSGQSIVIDGGNRVGVFIVTPGSATLLSDLIIQHGCFPLGNTQYGGGIYNDGTLTIKNSTVSYNSYSYCLGGGLVNSFYGSLTITNSTVSHNDSFNGGGVQNFGTLNISNSDISYNSSVQNGGGLFNQSGAVTLNNVRMFNNTITSDPSYGSGIYNLDGTITINDSTLANNTAKFGGGLFNDLHSTAILNRVTVINNQVTASGGGLYNDGSLTVSNSTLANNTANFGGGILSGGAARLSNTTITGNSAVQGGGIYSYNYNNGSSALWIFSTIVALNYSSTRYLEDVFGLIGSFGYNLVGIDSGTSTLVDGVKHDQVGTFDFPVDPMLGPLAANGGLTQTMALVSGSPAVSNGNCNGVTGILPAVSVDQRGLRRKSPCDVGAYELSPQDTIGIFRAGTFYLRLHNSTGNADLTVGFTAGTNPYPIVGDWTGSGFDTVGVFDQNNGQFTLCTANVTASCANSANQKSLVLGIANDQPLSGRWLLSATNAGVGVFRPSNGLIYLKTALTTGYADYTMVLGVPGDIGLAGDWNGKDFDSPGVYRPSNSFFYLSNQVKNGSVFGDYQFAYGLGGDAPVVGDWIAQGHDGVGLFRQSNGFTYLKNALTTGYADNTFTYGIAGDVPVAGHWQAVYPPVPPISNPAPILIAKTAVPVAPSNSIGGNDPIGD